MPQLPQIPVLRSRHALGLHALTPLPLGMATDGLPLIDWGVTWSMAQETRWLDQDTFAVGRWDGTLTLFRLPDQPKQPPLIESAAITPAWAGVQMITPIGDGVFATSNDAESMVVWEMQHRPAVPDSPGTASGSCAASGANALQCRTILQYDASLGVATHGAVVERGDDRYFVSGHSSGSLIVWRVGSGAGSFSPLNVIDIKSPEPVPSPYPLVDVRGVAPWRDGLVVTGSEDGDICIVSVPSGHISARMRYSPHAQRGINDISLAGDLLLVANCSVGQDDRNAWLFRLDAPNRITPLVSTNLRQRVERRQVFNFSVELTSWKGKAYFFAATEEGLLWMGTVDEAGFAVLGSENVSSSHGATVTLERASNMLAVIGDNIHLFQLA